MEPPRYWAGAVLVSIASLGCGVLIGTMMSPPPEVELDYSGYGHCNGSSINVTWGGLWTQSPARLMSFMSIDSAVIAPYVGKNAIAWTAATEGFIEFDVVSVNGTVIFSNKDLQGDGLCHFTLDSCGTSHWYDGVLGIISSVANGFDKFLDDASSALAPNDSDDDFGDD